MKTSDLKPILDEVGIDIMNVVEVRFLPEWWEVHTVARTPEGRIFGGREGAAKNRVCFTYDAERDEAESTAGREDEGRVPGDEGVEPSEA